MTSNMLTGAAKLNRYGPLFHYCPFRFTSLHRYSSLPPLEEALKTAVEVKEYQKIPDLLSSKEAVLNPNPFSFLSTFPQNTGMKIIDEILQSFIPLRPRSRPRIAYACLLLYTLQSSKPLPFALAILQRMLYSGCVPVPQTHLLLSSAWLEHRCQSECVSNILLEMQSIGYRPDCGTCNYLISSLCRVDQLMEAVEVLKGMGGAGCVPDMESYGIVIDAMSTVRKTNDAAYMLKEMVGKMGLMPRQATVVKVAVALRANREIWKAVEIIEFLEREGCTVGFDSYEVVVEGCLECSEYILAGKVAMWMAERGFLPFIKVRQKVVERLAGIGEWELACNVRQRFSELRS